MIMPPRMAECTATKLNMEMAATAEMREIALRIKPADVCIVPERRLELTTEGGLDVIAKRDTLAELVAALSEAGIRTSLFIAPQLAQIDAARDIAAPVIELHTGQYADADSPQTMRARLDDIAAAARHAAQIGLIVNAGHGLHYANAHAIAAIDEITELNIGHSIVARALAVGFPAAVGEMRNILDAARNK